MNKKFFTTIIVCLLILIALPASSSRSFEKALPGYTYRFPFDHGSHPAYQTEWWYYTGHLMTEGGDEYGYELTFFRNGTDNPKILQNPSRWTAKEIYLAHFAISDVHQKQFYYAEKISREALGKAGAEVGRLSVWIDQWRVFSLHGPPDSMAGIHHLQASHGPWAIDLELVPTKPPVIHGEKGISQKGKEPGEASHYYSLTRMEVTGTLQQGGKLLPVKGIGWMDHEFSTHSLPKKLVGWDWFSIQLDNRWELMIYQLRQRDGNPSPLSSGSLVDPKGEGIPLYLRDFQIEVLDHWKSPKSQGRYPIRWRLTLPREDIDLILTPLLKEQELLTPESTRVTYWEGAVAIQGTWQGRSITGRGYTEMTGYAGDLIHP